MTDSTTDSAYGVAADGKSPLWDECVNERDRELRRTYGLKLAWWQQLLWIQRGRCPGCDRLFAPTRRPCVDHDHATGEIRGLLCSPCNRGLKRRLVAYIADPPARLIGPFFVPRVKRARAKRRSNLYYGRPLGDEELIELIDDLSR